MAGFRSPLFVLGLSTGTQRVGFRGPLPVPQISVGPADEQRVGFRGALPLPQIGVGQSAAVRVGFVTPIPFYFGYVGEAIVPPDVEPTRGGGGSDWRLTPVGRRIIREDEELMVIIMAAMRVWN